MPEAALFGTLKDRFRIGADSANDMTPRTHAVWQLSLAAVQSVGAIVAIVGYFLTSSSSVWSRLVWSLLAIAIVGAFVGRFVNAQRHAANEHADAQLAHAAAPEPEARWSAASGRRIHCFVPLTLWSAVASLVIVYMSNRRTALLLVALAPLWIIILALAAMRVTPHRESVVAMVVLFCGLLGAWLAADGDSAAGLGFLWYSLAGYIVAVVLLDRDATVSVVTALICTALFVLLTAFIIGREIIYPLVSPSDFIRTGAPFFALEVYLVLSGRWLLRAWSTMRADRNGEQTPKRLPE